ncbi:MAG: hypothetical protein IJV90_02855 [Candidatus Methanomethylophilaceae archaeon]|nr:hypothetical protein [Candidatus Methanomethylophilaceae archaeon]
MTAIPVDGILRLEEKGMFGIVTLIHDKRYCTITYLYRNISRNPRLEIKLEILEDMGLVSCDIVHGHRMYTLTPKGEVIAEHILEIDDMIGDG